MQQVVRSASVKITGTKDIRDSGAGEATIIGLPNSYGEVTVEIAVVSMEDSLGGTYLFFTRRKNRLGRWMEWNYLSTEPADNYSLNELVPDDEQ